MERPAALLPTTPSRLLVPAPKARAGHQRWPASSPAVILPATGSLAGDRINLYAFGAQGPGWLKQLGS
jgi:hypothetical protein